MGCPTTWLTLCLYNLACAEYSFGSELSVVRGDDLLGVCTPEQASLYEECIEGIGLVPNREKSFRSYSFGCFAEHFIYKDSFGKLRLRDTLLCKELVYPTSLPDTAEMIERCTSGKKRAAVISLLYSSRPGSYLQYKKAGIPLTLPREFGGLGLPHRRGYQGAMERFEPICRFVLTTKLDFAPESFWTPSTTFEERKRILTERRMTTKALAKVGALSTSVPGAPDLNQRLLISVNRLMMEGKAIGVNPPPCNRVAKRVKGFLKMVKRSGLAPNPLNVSKWNRSLVAATIKQNELEGIYTSISAANELNFLWSP